MINTDMKIENDGKLLVIRVDLTKSSGLSKSGKSETVASTSGNVPVGDTGIRIGLNVYKPVAAVN